MPTAQQQARLARLEAETENAGHVGVILYRDRDDVPRLIAEAQCAGRVSPHHGLVVLPEPMTRDDWIAAADAHRLATYRGS